MLRVEVRLRALVGRDVSEDSCSIVKGFTNIAMYFMAKEYTRVNSPFALGMELGQIFWLIFFPATDYLNDALAKGASWGQDYTWDQVIAL